MNTVNTVYSELEEKNYSFCLMVEASDHGYVLRTRRIHVTRYRIRYDMISDKITQCSLLSECKHIPVTAPHNRTGLLLDADCYIQKLLHNTLCARITATVCYNCYITRYARA
jgi:hypothetical protein